MSITTKTGDNGETSLLTGERVKKSGLRVDTYGTLDEVDSALGLARAFSDKDDVAERILKLQRKLPALMADFASCGTEPRITMEDVREIESWCDDVESDLPEEHAFIIPGGSQSGAMLDLARTTARRAERCACRLAEAEEVAESDPSISIGSRITVICSCASKKISTRTTEPLKKNLCPCRQRTIVQSSAGTFLHEDS